MGDPERYRSQAEVTKWREDDPIGIFRKYLLDEKTVSETELDQIDRDAERIISEAVQFAESSPEPEPEELYAHIYYEKEGEGL
jgi:pyruvate dehydrogenase E1 component alpha subunit